MQRTTTILTRLGRNLVAVVILTAACGADDNGSEADLGADEATEAGDDSGAGENSTPSSTTTLDPTTLAGSDPGSTTSSNAATSTTTETSASTETSTEPSTETSTNSSSRTGATTIDGLVDVRAVPIASVTAVDATTIEIVVEGGVEPCFIVQRVDAVETVDDVELTVHAGSEPGAVCIQIVELHTATVGLADPLGDRPIVDGATGRTVALAP